jgi:DNA ligase-1
MQLQQLVQTSKDVADTRSRLRKRALLSDCLRAAGPEQVALVVSYLTGNLPQGRIGLGPAILRELRTGTAADTASLSLRNLDAAFDEIANLKGQGSQQRRRECLGQLFSAATTDEQGFLARLILGELRQGALEGVFVDAIAEAASLPAPDVRRAVMLAGDAAAVAAAALGEGPSGLTQFQLKPLSPVKPMLAQPAGDMRAALDAQGEAAIEYKLDGARVQIHKVRQEVRVYSRRLHDVTNSVPEIVETVRTLPTDTLILDGEVIALRENGRPHPFQTTMRRFGRKSDVEKMRASLPLNVFLFDCLYSDGDALIDHAARERFSVMTDGLPDEVLVPRIITDDVERAGSFLTAALNGGHEGVMVKSLDSIYAAGNRGAEWLKIKQAHTLDLVVLAAEWGSGRRKGWLSNLHLGARDPAGGGFVMLGKTFKGMTDELLKWQTEKLQQIAVGTEDHVVHVRPELVVEIAVNEIQASPQYPAGMALRFARVKGYRPDKAPGQADTIDTVRELYAQQTGQ